MSGTKYRVDRVAKHPDYMPADAKYEVPCGMNSIVYLDDKPPSIGYVMENLSKPLEQDEVLLFSTFISSNFGWYTDHYVVSQVVGASVSNGAVVSLPKDKYRLCPECRDVMIPAAKSCCSFCVPGEGPVASNTVNTVNTATN